MQKIQKLRGKRKVEEIFLGNEIRWKFFSFFWAKNKHMLEKNLMNGKKEEEKEEGRANKVRTRISLSSSSLPFPGRNIN